MSLLAEVLTLVGFLAAWLTLAGVLYYAAMWALALLARWHDRRNSR